jgi:RimJ/RimL family protein N-acetyltransferase
VRMTERSAEGVLLETERLVLRQFTMADVDNLAELDANPDAMRMNMSVSWSGKWM